MTVLNTIVFIDFIQYKNNAGAEIKITYSATVNEDAVIGVVGNPNTVYLTYSNNPNIVPGGENEPEGEDPKGKTPEDETRTYVTGIEIIKVDPEGNVLTGAQFEIVGTKLNKVLVSKETFVKDENGEYWKLTDGTYTTDDPTTAGMDTSKYENTSVKYTLTVIKEVVETSENVTATGTVDSNGVLTFEGLSAGTYTITEIKAPNGYNLLKDSITVTIGWEEPKTGSTDCTWTYQWTYTGDDSTNVQDGTSINSIKVVNQAGKELPSTGGMGTTMFYLIGGVLVVAAVVLLVTKKRMNA